MVKRIGERIRELREEQDFSLREFARKLDNLSAAHLSDIELGRRYPSQDLLKKIASNLHVPIEELEKLDSRPPVEELKRMAEANPSFGFALRKMLEEEVSPQAILDYLDEKSRKGKK
jgi:transcriptional regulator with XRE-family HTH domain